MSKSIELNVNIKPTIDQRQIQSEIKNVKGIEMPVQVDASTARKAIDAFQQRFAEWKQSFNKGLNVDLKGLDQAKLAASIKETASQFDKFKKEAESAYNTQLEAVRKLITAGKTQTDEYKTASKELASRKKIVQEMSAVEKEYQAKQAQSAKASGPSFDILKYNALIDVTQKLSGAFSGVLAVGMEFEKNLKSVGAFTGVTGDDLTALGGKARELALQFGTSASSQLESFSGILSKMGPVYAQNGEALKGFAATINVLSKAAGIDAGTSMEVVTNSMLQFGLRTGDATKDTATARNVINGLAASARAGAAPISAVGESILVCGSAAKNANISLDETTAAIQVMAVGGKTGSEAGNALRNVISMLQKPSGEAADALKKMGLSSDDLAKTLTTKGLGAAMEQLKTGMSKFNTDAERNNASMKLFGLENASAASILMSNSDRFKEFNDAIKEGQTGVGVAYEMMAQKSGTAAGMVNKWKIAVQDTFISIYNTMGSSGAAVLKASTDVAPMVTSIVGLKNIAPDAIKGLKDMGTQTAQLVPNIVKFVKGTEGATVAQKLFNMTAAMNPYVLLAVGVAGLVVGLHFLTSALKDSAQSRLDDLKTQEEELKVQTSGLEATKKTSESKLNLIQSYEQLGGKANKTAEEQKKLGEITVQLAQAYPGVISSSKSFEGNLTALQAKVKSTGDEINTTNTKLLQLGKQLGEINTQKLQAEVDLSVEKMGDAAVASGNVLNKASDWLLGTSTPRQFVEEQTAAMIQGIKSATTAEGVSSAVADAQMAVFQGKEWEGVPDAVKSKMVNGLKDAGNKQIEAINSNNENIKKTQESATKIFEDNSTKMAEIQNKIDNGTASKTEISRYDSLKEGAQQYLTELSKVDAGYQLNAAKLREMQELKAQYDAGNKLIKPASFDSAALEKEMGVQLQQIQTMTKKSIEGGFDAKEVMTKFTQSTETNGAGFQDSVKVLLNRGMGDAGTEGGSAYADAIKKKIEEAQLELAIKKAVAIKEVNTGGGLEKLVSDFNKAGSEMEKAQIAEKIKAIAPEAVKAGNTVVDANGNTITSYSIVSSKIDEAKSKEKERQDSATGKITESINKEGSAYQDNLAKIKELAAKIDFGKSMGLDVSQYQRQMGIVQTELNNSKNSILNVGASMKSAGLDSDTMYKLMAEKLGVSKEKVKELVTEQVKSKDATSDQTAAVKTLGDAWSSAMSESKKAVADGINQINAIKKKIADGDKSEATKKELVQIKEKIKAKQGEVVAGEKINKQTEIEIKGGEKRSGTAKTAYELAKKAYDLEEKKLSQESKTFEIASETVRIESGRAKDAGDDYALEAKKLEVLNKQKQAFADILKTKGIIVGEKGEITLEGKVKLKKDGSEKTEIENKIAEFNNSITEGSNKLKELSLKAKIDDKELQKRLAELDFKKLEFMVEMGFVDKGAILAYYKKQNQDVIKEVAESKQKELTLLDDFNKRAVELKAQADSGAISYDEYSASYDAAETSYNSRLNLTKTKTADLETVQIDSFKKIQAEEKRIKDERDKALEDASAKRMETLKKESEAVNKKLDEEIKAYEKFYSSIKDVQDRAFEISKARASDGLDAQKKDELQRLGDTEQAKLDIE